MEKPWSCQIQNLRLGAFLIIYTFKQNLRLKAKKYNKINSDTLFKSYDHAEFNSGGWKQILQPILSCKILG